MRRNTVGLLALLLGALIAATPVLAHHSFAAQYDSNKPIDLKGKVTKIEWMNPHVYFYVDVTETGGKVINYAIESGAPNGLYRQGWRKDSLKSGDTVSVTGFLAKDGSYTVNARNVTLPDGRRVFGGSADDGGPTGRR